MKLLAFDYGASSGRALLGEYNGSRINLREVHRFSNDPVEIHGTLYWDTYKQFHEMKQGILKCVKTEGEISGTGIDTWGVDFGLLDSQGQLISNAFHYRDKRTEGMIEKACSIIPANEIYNSTGIAFQKFNTLYQLMGMSESGRKIFDNAKTLLFTPDLMGYFMTGEKYCEYTIATTSQMIDAKTRDWDYGMLEKLGVPNSFLQKVSPSCRIIGNISESICRDLNIKAFPFISVAGHDTASAVGSIPAEEGRYAYISSGTWSLMGVELDKPVINDSTFTMNYTNEGGINYTTRLLKNIMGLWIYQECKRYWDKAGNTMSYDDLEEAAASAQPFTCFIDPDDDSFYNPGDMPSKVMDYCRAKGQKLPEGKGGIVRCIMESLALKYRMTIEGLEKILGFKLPVIHIVGGGSQNILLSGFTANATGKTTITGPVEATGLGNLICQLMASGEVKNLNEARMIVKNSFPVKYYEPKDKDTWDDAYDKFLGIVSRKS